MTHQQKLLLHFYVKKFFRIKRTQGQKLMTLLINQVLFSFEMRRYATFTEMSMILTTITKAPTRMWALDRNESCFEDL